MTPTPNENQAEKHSAEDAIENLSSYLRSDGAPESTADDLATIYAELSTLRKELEAVKGYTNHRSNCAIKPTRIIEEGFYTRVTFGDIDEDGNPIKCTCGLGELLNNGKDGR